METVSHDWKRTGGWRLGLTLRPVWCCAVCGKQVSTAKAATRPVAGRCVKAMWAKSKGETLPNHCTESGCKTICENYHAVDEDAEAMCRLARRMES